MSDDSWRHLPTLTALRAFEAAARHQNFSKAADELFVTHGAISHQIRGLEETLGLSLFERQGKRVRLTDAGTRYAQSIRSALSELLTATARIKRSSGQERLTISVLPSFGARWLTPRIGRFIEQFPWIDVVMLSSLALTDFAREEVDVGVRMGYGNWPGLNVELLLDDGYFPACSPSFNHGKLPHSCEEIAKAPLLRNFEDYWPRWFIGAGLRHPPQTGGTVLYQDSLLALRAAVEGQGVVLTRRVIAREELRDRRLVRLHDYELPSPENYFLVYLPSAQERPAVKTFRAWLLEETRRYRQEENRSATSRQ